MPHTGQPEKDIFRVRPSIVPYLAIVIGLVVLGIILTIIISQIFSIIAYAILAIIIFIALVIILLWLSTEYALTTERIEFRTGVINTKYEFIENDQISSVELHHSLLGKVFNYGDVVVEGHNIISVFTFKYISSPKMRLEQINHQTIEKKNSHP